MRILKKFNDYLKKGIARNITPDKERAKNLIIESERKTNSVKEQIRKIGVKNENANDYVEQCYDIIMHLIRAKMYQDGYKTTGKGAHKAEVSYMRIINLKERDVQFMNQLRYYRNGILYYGTRMDKEYAEKVINYTKKIIKIIKKSLH